MPTDLRFSLNDDKGIFAFRAGAIMVKRDGPNPSDARLLMVTSNSFDFIYSVGGAVEFGETARESVAREVREETGVDLPIGDLAAIEQAVYPGDDGRTWHMVAFHYWVDIPSDFDPVTESVTMHGDLERICWIGLADIEAGVRYFPKFYRDVLEGPWQGVRQYIDRDRPEP